MRYIINAINQRPRDAVRRRRKCFEATLFGLIASTDDMREGTRAFLEKRKAEFEAQSSDALRAGRFQYHDFVDRAAASRARSPR